eukprot:scaffold65005_cov63-Phaeocystis_antarctica.AAC.1
MSRHKISYLILSRDSTPSLAFVPPRARAREEHPGLLKAGLDGAVGRLRHRLHAAARGTQLGLPCRASLGLGLARPRRAADLAARAVVGCHARQVRRHGRR